MLSSPSLGYIAEAGVAGLPWLNFHTACSGTITTGARPCRARWKLANSACGVGERLVCTLRTIWVKIGSAFGSPWSSMRVMTTAPMPAALRFGSRICRCTELAGSMSFLLPAPAASASVALSSMSQVGADALIVDLVGERTRGGDDDRRLGDRGRRQPYARRALGRAAYETDPKGGVGGPDVRVGLARHRPLAGQHGGHAGRVRGLHRGLDALAVDRVTLVVEGLGDLGDRRGDLRRRGDVQLDRVTAAAAPAARERVHARAEQYRQADRAGERSDEGAERTAPDRAPPARAGGYRIVAALTA